MLEILIHLEPQYLIFDRPIWSLIIPLVNVSATFYNIGLIVVKQAPKSMDNSVVVHKLELAIKRGFMTFR